MFEASNFFPVLPESLPNAWPHLAPFVEDFSRLTCMVRPEEVLRQARCGECQLWSYHDGQFRCVIATRVYPDAIGRVCEFWAAIGLGEDELIDGAYAQIERWALDIGCYKTKIIGREGWQRRLPGYKRTAVVLEKLLTGVH